MLSAPSCMEVKPVPLYSHQERRLNNFYLRCLRRILGITWRDRITNTAVLERELNSPACTLYCDNVVSDGWVMYVGWMMDESRKTFFMQSLHLVKDRLVAPSCDSRMSARMISGALALPLPAGKIWLRTALGGSRLSVEDCSCLKSP